MAEEKNEEEKGFNESELQDIMNEIETLEQEYAGDHSDREVSHESQQHDHDHDENEHLDDVAEEANPGFDESSLQDKHMTEEKEDDEEGHMKIDSHEDVDHNMKHSAPMDISMNLTVGGKPVSLKVDSKEGITCEVEGVWMKIHPEKGCQLEMKGGATFSIPIEESHSHPRDHKLKNVA